MADDVLELTGHDFTTTESHWWWREGWGPGTRYLTWHLTFEDAPDLHAAANASRIAFQSLPHVDPIPPEWLHMTMTGVGFAGDHDDVTVSAHAERVIAAVADLEVSPIVFDRIFLAADGVSLISPTPWLHDLKRLQVAAVKEIGGPVPGSNECFYPHVSLAYFSGQMPQHEVTNAVRAAGLRRFAVMRPRLSLLELGRDNQMYTWRVIAQSDPLTNR